MTLAEEAPDYAERASAYLTKVGRRRLPWGAILVHNHLTYTTSASERAARADLGETAIQLLAALGVTAAQLEALDAMAAGASGLELVAKLAELQSVAVAAPVPEAVPALPPVGLGT